MSWVIVTLIAPTNKINASGKEINIKDIDIIKINENGTITFIEKQTPVASSNIIEVTESELPVQTC